MPETVVTRPASTRAKATISKKSKDKGLPQKRASPPSFDGGPAVTLNTTPEKTVSVRVLEKRRDVVVVVAQVEPTCQLTVCGTAHLAAPSTAGCHLLGYLSFR